jgi:hypothetical protein
MRRPLPLDDARIVALLSYRHWLRSEKRRWREADRHEHQ